MEKEESDKEKLRRVTLVILSVSEESPNDLWDSSLRSE